MRMFAIAVSSLRFSTAPACAHHLVDGSLSKCDSAPPLAARATRHCRINSTGYAAPTHPFDREDFPPEFVFTWSTHADTAPNQTRPAAPRTYFGRAL